MPSWAATSGRNWGFLGRAMVEKVRVEIATG